MPEVLPFRGVRYAVSRQALLSSLIAPPYDSVSPAAQAVLAARDPHNVIHLILDQGRPGDAPGENRYVRARHAFASWLEEGMLRQDASPAVYPLEQTFTGPDGRPRFRRSVIVACRLHDYSEGIVLPHERTLSAYKVDRLEVLKSVHANLSPLFGLYEDEGGAGQRTLDEAIAGFGEVVGEAESDDGTHHRLWRVTDPLAIASFQEVLAARRVFIADGHTRYESALAYRDLVDREQPALPDRAGHRYAMMALCSMADPGLVIYPTHRLLVGLEGLRTERLVERLGQYFTIDTLEEDLRRPAGCAWAVAKLAEHAGKSTTLLMVSGEDGKGRILTLRDDVDLGGVPVPSTVTLRDLDVTALHSIIFQHLLGLSPEAQEPGEHLRYELDAGEVVNRTLSGEYQLGFLVNPTPMWQVQAVAESGETMPQKSTFFYPKVAAGLVMRRLDEQL